MNNYEYITMLNLRDMATLLNNIEHGAEGRDNNESWEGWLYKEHMPELKACPFCGKTNCVHVYSANEIDESFDSCNFAAVCDAQEGGCGATGAYATSRVDAAKNWNRRA